MTAHDAQECPVSGASPTPYLPLDHLCGPRSAMRTLLERARRLIDRQLPLLLLGETGTGKEYLARALHDYSRRRRAALIALNCASIPENLVESELFGYQRGAFSGALPGGMKGKVVLADRGTLFLDEVGDMPAAQQTRLLRVLS
jgi:transcriptional regulator with PAS, ATPase and Fis domain